MVGHGSHTVALGDYCLDLASGLLRRGQEPVRLRAKPYRLLEHLARNPGRIVTKSELMTAVWGDVFVTEDSLTQAVKEIRKALGDDAQQTIRTISGRGYMLVPATPAPESRQLPIVAVLRFQNAGDRTDEPLVDGFVEDIIVRLARFRSVMVLGHTSTFSVQSGLAGAAQLGADFAVEGSLRRTGERLDISVSLATAPAGVLAWNERYVADGSDVFAVLDDISEQIVNRLVKRLEDAGTHRAAATPTDSLAAYELLLRGIGRLRGYQPEDNEAAREYFEAAIDKDPAYGLAHGYLGLAVAHLVGDIVLSPEVFDQAIAHGARGVALAPEEPRCHRILGIIRLFASQHSGAEGHMRRALDLNPHDADTMTQLGYVLTLRGRPLEGLALMEKAEKINPIHPDWYDCNRSMALYGIGDYAGALVRLERMTSQPPWQLAHVAACQAQDGKVEQARQTLSRALAIAPDFSPTLYARHGVPYEHASDTDHLAEGIAKALDAN